MTMNNAPTQDGSGLHARGVPLSIDLRKVTAIKMSVNFCAKS